MAAPCEFKLLATRSKRYRHTDNPSASVLHFPKLLARQSMWASLQIADVALYIEGYVVDGLGYMLNTVAILAKGKFKLLLFLVSLDIS